MSEFTMAQCGPRSREFSLDPKWKSLRRKVHADQMVIFNCYCAWDRIRKVIEIDNKIKTDHEEKKSLLWKLQ